MIGLNDWGFLPNPIPIGNRHDPIHISDDSDRENRVVGVPETRITNKYIRMMDEIWRETHGDGY